MSASEQPTSTTPAEASLQLDALVANPEFRSKLLAGHSEEGKQFADLLKLKSDSDKIDQILAGAVEPPPFETVMPGELSTRNIMQSVEWLRESGVGDDAIKQATVSAPVSKAEFDAVKRLHADRCSNPEWTAKLIKGGAEQKRELMLMQIVLAAGFKEEKVK